MGTLGREANIFHVILKLSKALGIEIIVVSAETTVEQYSNSAIDKIRRENLAPLPFCKKKMMRLSRHHLVAHNPKELLKAF